MCIAGKYIEISLYFEKVEPNFVIDVKTSGINDLLVIDLPSEVVHSPATIGKNLSTLLSSMLIILCLVNCNSFTALIASFAILTASSAFVKAAIVKESVMSSHMGAPSL